jgi:hypothetical protein
MSRQFAVGRQYTARQLTACAALAPAALLLANPNGTGTNDRMDGYVAAIRSDGWRKNTALVAFDPKQQEFQEFCEHVYQQNPCSTSTLLTLRSVIGLCFIRPSGRRNQPRGRGSESKPRTRRRRLAPSNLIGKSMIPCQKCLRLRWLPSHVHPTKEPHWQGFIQHIQGCDKIHASATAMNWSQQYTMGICLGFELQEAPDSCERKSTCNQEGTLS